MTSKFQWVNGASQKEWNRLESLKNLASRGASSSEIVRAVENIQVHLKQRKNKYDFSYLLAFYLGVQMGLGLMLALKTTLFVDLGLYLFLLSVFHMWEYIYVSLYHPDTLNYKCMYMDLHGYPF